MRRELHAQRRQACGAPLALEGRARQLGIAKLRIQRKAGDEREAEAIGRQKAHEACEPQRHHHRVRERIVPVFGQLLMPCVIGDGEFPEDQGGVGKGGERERQNDLQRQRHEQRPPLNAHRSPVGHQDERQEIDVLQHAGIPGREQRQVRHLGHPRAHAVRPEHVRQRHVGPEQSHDGKELTAAQRRGVMPL